LSASLAAASATIVLGIAATIVVVAVEHNLSDETTLDTPAFGEYDRLRLIDP
jgi:hypothetical protein